jgi:hypothetical protein
MRSWKEGPRSERTSPSLLPPSPPEKTDTREKERRKESEKRKHGDEARQDRGRTPSIRGKKEQNGERYQCRSEQGARAGATKQQSRETEFESR